MSTAPYASLTWHCSECGGIPVEDRADDHDLCCEYCGIYYRVVSTTYAEHAPSDEDLIDNPIHQPEHSDGSS